MLTLAEKVPVVVALGDTQVQLSLEDEAARRMGERSLVQVLSRMGHRERDQILDRLEDDLELSLPIRPPVEFAPLSWDQVRELGSRGVTFGPHGVTHSNLAALSPEQVRWEIAHSWERVRFETDAVVPVFCYPYGRAWSVPRNVSGVFKESGLLGAVTAEAGHVSLSQVSEKPFALPRIGWPSTPLEVRNITSGLVWAHKLLVPES
jgi:peptidoglycan/xylan/chitin deacetylase (PgdA/CDA1 family)